MKPAQTLKFLVCTLGAFLLLGPGLFAGERARPGDLRRAVVITSDTGADMDDEWTIAQAVLAPELDVRGIITTHAPSLAAPAAGTAARHARTVLQNIPMRTRPPVFAGASVPLKSKTASWTNSGVTFLLEQSRGFTASNRLAVLALGAATDIASALLVDPSCADRIEIIAMAFNGWPEGTDSWNVKNDVRAWQVLLESRAPIVIGDARVTGRDLALNRKQVRELFGARGDPGSYLIALHTKWLDRDPPFIKSVTGDRDTWPIWDSVTLAHLLGMTKSEDHPRPRLGDDMKFVHRPNPGMKEGTVRWITTIDSQRLWQHFVTQLEVASKAEAKWNAR